MTTTTVSTREARDSFADRIDAARRGDATVITSRGHVVAAIVPAGFLEHYEQLQEALDGLIVANRLADWEAAGRPTVSLDEVIAETEARDR